VRVFDGGIMCVRFCCVLCYDFVSFSSVMGFHLGR